MISRSEAVLEGPILNDISQLPAGALMLDARQNVFVNDPSWFFPR